MSAMSDDRAAFEKWVTPRYGFELTRTEDGYRDFAINDEWEAWRAGMRAGIERALAEFAQQEPECCGSPTVGAEYMGQQEIVCCGCPEPRDRTLPEVEAAIRALLEGKT